MKIKEQQKITEHIRSIYKPGSRVRLLHMSGEPQMKYGDEGTVRKVDDAGQIHVRWDKGSSLALILDEDEFIKI